MVGRTVVGLLFSVRGDDSQVVDAAISESMFNMLEGCLPELAKFGYTRPPSGSTITGKIDSD